MIGSDPQAMRYQIGLSLGTRASLSGLSIIEQTGQRYKARNDDSLNLKVRWLERFEPVTSYPAIIEHIKEMVAELPETSERPNLIIDATAVGLAVADLFSRAEITERVISVTITGGFEVSEPERDKFIVPKRELVSTVDAVLQSDKLRIAPGLTEADTLTRALQGFQLKTREITAEATSMLWREDAQDDLVFAVALACWFATIPVYQWNWA